MIEKVLTDICNEVDILTGASSEFISLVEKLELIEDTNERSNVALKYLQDNSLATLIPYPELYKLLAEKDFSDINRMRWLYILERSLPRRPLDKATWLNRLRVFVDTYLLEHSLVNKTFLGNGPLRFTRFSGDHEALHAGKGKYGADFYFWSGYSNFVECKHWRNDFIDEARLFYSDKRYNADNVIVCLYNKDIYWIDYKNKTTTKIADSSILPQFLIW